MPYSMQFYYNGTDKDDKIAVKVYNFSTVGQLGASALVYTTEGKDPNENGEQPTKETWLNVPVNLLKPTD